MREINSLTKLQHENIVCLKEVMQVSQNILCLVLEYAGGGELYDYIIERERLSEEEAREFFKQIVLAIEHCHSRNVVHRGTSFHMHFLIVLDLKLENILLDVKNNIKLADFGFSTSLQNGKQTLTSRCGSPMYAAPEVLSADPYVGPEAR